MNTKFMLVILVVLALSMGVGALALNASATDDAWTDGALTGILSYSGCDSVGVGWASPQANGSGDLQRNVSNGMKGKQGATEQIVDASAPLGGGEAPAKVQAEANRPADNKPESGSEPVARQENKPESGTEPESTELPKGEPSSPPAPSPSLPPTGESAQTPEDAQQPTVADASEGTNASDAVDGPEVTEEPQVAGGTDGPGGPEAAEGMAEAGEPDATADPEATQAPVIAEALAGELPPAERRIIVEREIPDIIRDGEEFRVKATLIGYDDVDYKLQWQYDDGKGEGWKDAPGANRAELMLIADPQNVNYDWRILVAYTISE